MTTATQLALIDATADNPSGQAHYVFTWPCGCRRIVIDASTVADVDGAWRAAAPLKAEPAFLRYLGVQVEMMSHADYVARYPDTARTGCPHREGR